MMLRIGRGEKYLLTAVDKWNIQTLQDAGILLADITAELARHTQKSENEVKEAMEEAGVKALAYDDAVYKSVGLNPIPLEESPHLIRLMERAYNATNGELRNFTRTIANASQRLFITKMDEIYNQVTSGSIGYTQAVQQAIDEIVRDGVYVTYPSGRKDTIETATLRCVRTGVSQATGDIQMARMQEMDWDIVLVSAHIGARTGDGGNNPSNHYWWQGQFYSRTGRTPHLPLFAESTGYGTVTGLCGANCRHSFGTGDGVNNPYKDYAKSENYTTEKLNQRQRTLERRIRETKRELQGYQTEIATAQNDELKALAQSRYDKCAFKLQRQNKAYNEFCEVNNRKRLEDRLRIAKWDREQAAKARGAARRYQKQQENKNE